MRYLTLLFIAFVLTACHSKRSAKDKWLEDTISSLRKQADFKPLPLDEAYDFINKYYLPKLDSISLGRKLGIHPLLSTDNETRFIKIASSKKISGLVLGVYLAPPPYSAIDTNFRWSAERLKNILIVNDTITPFYHAALDSIQKQIVPPGDRSEAIIRSGRECQRSLIKRLGKDFKKAFGDGYISISYPQYNVHTDRLEIKTYLNDNGDCPSGKSNTYFFKKTASGWKETR